MGIKLTNNANATLAAGINSSATSITLTSGQGARFPTLGASDYFYATLVDTSNNLEIVKCTARSTDVLTVVRAQESTTARAYSTGDRIEIRLTAQTFLDSTTIYDVLTASTGYFDLPSGTTAQRPGSPAVGMIRFNTDLNQVEGYHTTFGWVALSNNFIATGGTESISGGFKYHAFTSSGTFTVTSGTSNVEVLIVAGGGGAGDSNGAAGAGAGGRIYQSSVAVLTGAYSIVVGAGGAGTGGGYNGPRGNNGSNSTGFSYTAVGGGGSGTEGAEAIGAAGGSGGGGVRGGTGGAGTSGQGNAGGANINDGSPHYGGGGGGGAGAVGASGLPTGAGAGGVGVQYTQFSAFGASGWFAGGGGGGNYNNGSGGSGAVGGTGGGGGGGSQLSGAQRNGTANTGGGGGGHGIASNVGGTGGSGIVLIRYAI